MTGGEAPGPNPVGLLFRHVLRERMRTLFAPRSRVLDLGVALAPFDFGSRRDLDGAFGGLGALDQADLAALGPGLARALRPGAPVLLCLRRRPPTGYPGLRAARGRMGPEFVWRAAFALGVVVPGESRADWVRGHPQAFGVLAALEGVVRRWPLLRALGDYVAMEGARR